MNIRIQVRHEAAREAIQKHITTEFEHVSKKFTDGESSTIVSAEFIVDQEGSNGHVKTFEAIIHVPNDTITVKEHDPEVHKAIDAAMKVIEKLLTRHKEIYARPGTLIRHNVERRAPSA
ncbi:MAG TPA: HPF/RaiA family ribosome-associated protein [Candidatus Kapabacteria bacterium]|nr:HPF/RaiA family ribosome-associated protein [Candidatus Kapabacteria bacterium]